MGFAWGFKASGLGFRLRWVGYTPSKGQRGPQGLWLGDWRAFRHPWRDISRHLGPGRGTRVAERRPRLQVCFRV
jgi:hypothetical protein